MDTSFTSPSHLSPIPEHALPPRPPRPYSPLVRGFTRPFLWAVLTALAVLVLAMLLLGPLGNGTPASRPIMKPLPDGDQEIVWLNPATSAPGWERFVSAVHHVQASAGDLSLQVDDSNAFPPQTTAIPELSLSVKGCRSRLWIRWYKLTGDLDMHDWVEALTQRPRPPLAIIGGGSSDRARDLAKELGDVRRPSPPLLLITTATADEVPSPTDPASLVELNSLYPGRTFRFCFTNRQMAEAVAKFIWRQDDLRPDADPVYLVSWNDDPYSEDLTKSFKSVLYENRQRRDEAIRQASQWGRLTSQLAIGGPLYTLDLPMPEPREPEKPFWSIPRIASSIGMYDTPNAEEERAAAKLMEEGVEGHAECKRPLLILPATAQPTRRFLRALMRVNPAKARRFTVATGDSIEFNVICRDRRLAWPIQDLPFSLVLFCHRDPVAHFEQFAEGSQARDRRAETGTEDLLLFADIAETVVRKVYSSGKLLANADQLAQALRNDPTQRFDAKGNLAGSSGEFVVWLQPATEGERLLPRASLRVFKAQGSDWVLVRTIALDYR